jgi:hypothetical protein
MDKLHFLPLRLRKPGGYAAVVDAACHAWKALTAEPGAPPSITARHPLAATPEQLISSRVGQVGTARRTALKQAVSPWYWNYSSTTSSTL